MGEEVVVVIFWGDEIEVFSVVELFDGIVCYVLYFLWKNKKVGISFN